MTIFQIIIILSSVSLVTLVSIWAYLKQVKRNREATRKFNNILADPRVRSLLYQLIRNQYFDSPKNVFEKRSNNRRALAMIRLKRIVKDPAVRKKIYKLTDKSKW